MSQEGIAIAVFAVVMGLVISEKIHRAVAAAGGAVLLFALGIFDLNSGISYIDFNTIVLLVGMMLFVGVIRQSGLFEYLAAAAARLSGGRPWLMMVLFMAATALLSGLLDNVTTVLLMGPVTLAIAGQMKLDPRPFLITQILASNIGGTMTLIGDPPNIMIGSAAGLTFSDFLVNNGPVILLVMAVVTVFLWLAYGRKPAAAWQGTDRRAADMPAMEKMPPMEGMLAVDPAKMIQDRALLIKSVVMIGWVVAGFLLHNSLGLDSCIVALAAAAVMMVIGGQDIEQVIQEVEWSTILFFVGLFVVVGGLVETGVIEALAGLVVDLTEGRQVMTMIIILWSSALLSSILDNIPFVATMIPMIASMEAAGMEAAPLWWALSLGACLGGNGTLVGASANVVLSGISGKKGYPITYGMFLKVGFPVMLLSVTVCTVYLLVRYGL